MFTLFRNFSKLRKNNYRFEETPSPVEVTPIQKHTTVDVGSLGSIAVRRTIARPVPWQLQVESLAAETEQPGSKTREKPDSTTKKGGRESSRRPGLYFCVCLFAMLFIIFVWPGPLNSKNLFYAMYFSNSWEGPDSCGGRRVYMYNLPPKFNVGVHNETRCKHSLIKWMDLCPRFSNGGYGLKLWDESKLQSDEDDFDYSQWFDTDFYMLEMIFHTRLQTYRCLTRDWTQADAFFIPYYTGLHALVDLYEIPDLTLTYEKRRLFGKELIDWLDTNGGEAWKRYGGIDHWLCMGRTTWDFKLQKAWGTGFSALPHVANMTTLMLERDIGQGNEQAIPYPTAFHPSSPDKLGHWIETVKSSNRKYLFSYVGAPRSDSWSVRGLISSACVKAGASVCNFVDCSVVKCSHDPVSVYKAFLQSTFSLQPRGDSATRRSTFDCLISGSIPVFFSVDSAYTQYSWHLPQQPASYSVYIDEADLKKGVSIRDVLMAYSQERIDEMRRNIVDIIPNLLYNDYSNDPWSPTDQKDAFEITIDRVLERIAAAKGKQLQGS